MLEGVQDRSGIRLFFPACWLGRYLFWDAFEYPFDEQVYLIAKNTGYTHTEILSLTRPERLKLFERIRKDVENDIEYRRILLETIARSAGARL